MKVKIKYFGMVAEAVGKEDEMIETQNQLTLNDLNQCLLKKYPIESIRYKISQNHSFESNDAIIEDQDEIALLPPFAGG